MVFSLATGYFAFQLDFLPQETLNLNAPIPIYSDFLAVIVRLHEKLPQQRVVSFPLVQIVDELKLGR